ncbi:ABC transporter permease [Nocardia farcinica]|uniref:Transport permease protein n=2 Tax=Nocardia farcinica TaxID=37329 RepID=Q5Z1W8_NOCFA|nr:MULTISPECIES: ABC transporter permease [Nocardia]MBF6072155.1 ABC transporter permease [Nocardia farcinica]MBF6138675.1 ABC transporter permease [Nocardia farcinica]MBF6187390.1 ABC transporter permease [Nocardia farcinica]MBF6232747.1 ABC transporter permease [Nocardia farcinica]MBF6262879.1 ABC transporter permease [Nocardia farcinica]
MSSVETTARQTTAPEEASATTADTEGFRPLPTVRPRSENAPATWARHSLLQCKRLLIGWLRDPATTIQTLIYPAATLLMFKIVLGNAIGSATGMPAVYGQVPMITLVAAMSGAVVSALGFKVERATGLLGRFYTMPMNRAAGLTGRLLAEAVRVLITTLFVLAVGLALGFRFGQGPLAALALIGIPVLFGVGFAVLVTALATLTEGVLLVSIIGIVNTLLMFFNTGFVPVFAYPTWLQDVVANQPMSTAIDAMRGLSYGGPVAEPLLKTLAWTIGLIVVFAWPAIRGYRRAAERG